jgi:hypothetical protein
MKTIKLILTSFLILLGTFQLNAQKNEVPKEIISALQKGKADSINLFLNTNVELIISNRNDVFSKPQASVIIKDFFKKNKVQSFKVLHKGNKESANFIIGTMKTNTNNYRVYLLTRIQKDKTIIQQLRIEPTNE